MKYITFPLFLIFASLVFTSTAQNISFSFSANHTCDYVESDSIFIENLTQGGDTTLYWNDTVLTFIFANINEINAIETSLHVSQNYPNPFENKTDIDVFVPEKDEFSIFVYDLAGIEVANYKNILDNGMHNFTFYAGNSKSYILTVQSGKNVQHIQMTQLGQVGTINPQITYNGITSTAEPIIKAKHSKAYFPYNIGDELRFTCYVSGDSMEITDSPTESNDYIFDIANNSPIQPLTGIHDVSYNNIQWSWSAVVNASGYKYNTSSDYSTAYDNGTYSSFLMSELEFCTEYFLYVWAYNSCGESNVLVLSETTSSIEPSLYVSPAFIDSVVKIRYYSATADSVSLAGEMNMWSPTPMTNICDNYWEISLIQHIDVEDGDEYKLLIDGTWYLDPKNPNQVDDGFGGYNSVIVFP